MSNAALPWGDEPASETDGALELVVHHANGSQWNATLDHINGVGTKAFIRFGSLAGCEPIWITDDERRGTFTRRAMRHWRVSAEDVERIIAKGE